MQDICGNPWSAGAQKCEMLVQQRTQSVQTTNGLLHTAQHLDLGVPKPSFNRQSSPVRRPQD